MLKQPADLPEKLLLFQKGMEIQKFMLWMLMVIFIILLAIGEDIKEGILIEQLEEIKSLKDSILKGKKKGNRLVK